MEKYYGNDMQKYYGNDIQKYYGNDMPNLRSRWNVFPGRCIIVRTVRYISRVSVEEIDDDTV